MADAMNDRQVTAELAKRVMGWRVGKDRFLLPSRSWIKSWKFDPLQNVETALDLVKRANGTCSFDTAGTGLIQAEVKIGDRIARASGRNQARVITYALAEALEIAVEEFDPFAARRGANGRQ